MATTLGQRAPDTLRERRAQLYRREVVEAEQSRLGKPTVIADVSTWLILCFLVLLLVAVVTYLCCSRFSRKETVSGLLQPVAGSAKITFAKPATVGAIFVKEGQIVRQGQPLFALVLDTSLEHGETLGDALGAAAKQQKAALADQLSAAHAGDLSQTQSLLAKVTALSTQERSFTQDQSLQQERLELDRTTLAALSSLAGKGFVSAIRLREQQVQVLNDRQSLVSLERQITQVRSDLVVASSELGQARSAAEQADARIRQQRAEIDEKQASVAAQAKVVLTAPIGGRIVTIRAQLGATTEPEKALALVLPQKGELAAELWAPTKAAGFVRSGDDVRVMFDAFPFERFGAAPGHVVSVSDTPVDPAELPIIPDTKEAMYRVRVALDRQYVSAYGRRWQLVPGSRLKADLILDRQSLMGWLLDPLLASRGRAAQ